jgi:hypothetical protein
MVDVERSNYFKIAMAEIIIDLKGRENFQENIKIQKNFVIDE